jgi:hypothetical protein
MGWTIVDTKTAVIRWPIVSGGRRPDRNRIVAGGRRPALASRLAHAFLCLLAIAGWLHAIPSARAGEPAIALDVSEIVEYWYWAGGVVVTGSGFAATSNVTVVATDPVGGVRQFAATTDAAGAFSVRINAMKLRSVLGNQIISAVDTNHNAAQAPLTVIRDPNDVLDVALAPIELPLAKFGLTGVQVRIGGLTPNKRVRINLGDPAENAGELMTSQILYADDNGAFTFVLDPNTEVQGWNLPAVVPTEGVWKLSVHDMSGENSHIGSGSFRMLPDVPGTQSYCAIDIRTNIEPITYTGFAGIDNASAVDATAGYEDFTQLQGEVTPGQSYSIRLQGKARWSYQANTYTVFIDWNHNGILDDPGEVYSVGSLLGSTGVDGMEVVYDIPVPENAVPGETRMRVLKVFSPSSFAMFWPAGACGRYDSGQAEDYTLSVVPSETIFKDGFEADVPVEVAPAIAKTFSPSNVAMNTPTALTITLANTNATAATLTADLVDAFPSGLVSAANVSTTCTGGPGMSQTGTSVTLGAGATIPAAGSCTINVQVAGQTAGNLTNTIPVGALVTDAGSNAIAAIATLTVAAPLVAPTLTKSFSPSSVAMNTPTALTITLANTNATAATLTADLVDAFPSGLVSAANVSTTCTGGPGLSQTGTSVTLRAGATIPAAGSCTINVHVAGQTAGSLTNTIPVDGLVTEAGSNAIAATATLTVAAPAAAPGQ